MIKNECARVRETLQDLHDAGEAPDAVARDHLLRCPDCAAFYAFLSGLPSDLRDALDAACSPPANPDYEAVFSAGLARRAAGRREKRFSTRQIAFAAAVAALIALAVPASLVTVSALRERAAMQETVTAFVEDLFRSPPVESADSGKASTLDSLLNDLAGD